MLDINRHFLGFFVWFISSFLFGTFLLVIIIIPFTIPNADNAWSVSNLPNRQCSTDGFPGFSQSVSICCCALWWPSLKISFRHEGWYTHGTHRRLVQLRGLGSLTGNQWVSCHLIPGIPMQPNPNFRQSHCSRSKGGLSEKDCLAADFHFHLPLRSKFFFIWRYPTQSLMHKTLLQTNLSCAEFFFPFPEFTFLLPCTIMHSQWWLTDSGINLKI